MLTDTVKPDLKITSVAWTPIDPAAGQPISFDLFVTNIANAAGDVNAIASTSNLGLYIDPGPCAHLRRYASHAYAEVQVASLGPLQSVEIGIGGALADQAQHIVYLMADSDCTVDEMTESNNLYGPIVFYPDNYQRPDLEVDLHHLGPVAGLRPLTDHAHGAGEEHGGGGQRGDRARDLLAGSRAGRPAATPQYDDKITVGPIPPGEYRDVQVVFDRGWAATGSKFVVAVVDWQCTLPELNDDEYQNNNENNTGYTWVDVVTELPDLAIQNVTYEPAEHLGGRRRHTERDRQEPGRCGGPGGIGARRLRGRSVRGVRHHRPGRRLDDRSGAGGGRKHVLNIEVPATAFDPTWTSGHDIYLFENYRCTGVEWNNANNGYGPISIAALRPDLAIESMTIAPASVHARQAVDLHPARQQPRRLVPARRCSSGISSAEYPDRCGETTWDFTPATVPALAAGASTDADAARGRLAGARRAVGLCGPRHGVRLCRARTATEQQPLRPAQGLCRRSAAARSGDRQPEQLPGQSWRRRHGPLRASRFATPARPASAVSQVGIFRNKIAAAQCAPSRQT